MVQHRFSTPARRFFARGSSTCQRGSLFWFFFVMSFSFFRQIKVEESPRSPSNPLNNTQINTPTREFLSLCLFCFVFVFFNGKETWHLEHLAHFSDMLFTNKCMDPPKDSVHCLGIGEQTGFPPTPGSLWMIGWQQQWHQPDTHPPSPPRLHIWLMFCILPKKLIVPFSNMWNAFYCEMHLTLSSSGMCVIAKEAFFLPIPILYCIQCSQYCLTCF